MSPRAFARFFALVFTVTLAVTVLLAQAKPLRLVSTVWPPFTNVSGEPRFALDLVEASLQPLDVANASTFVDAAQFTPAILTGPFDGSAAVWKDPERER